MENRRVYPFTGLDYWTEMFSFFGQVCVFNIRMKPTFFTMNISTCMATIDDCNIYIALDHRQGECLNLIGY